LELLMVGRWRNSLVSLVVRLVGESKIERCVARLVAQSHEVLSLTGAFVAVTVLVTAWELNISDYLSRSHKNQQLSR
jgi:putative lipoic acid-binding regulatory protein